MARGAPCGTDVISKPGPEIQFIGKASSSMENGEYYYLMLYKFLDLFDTISL